MCSRHPVIRVRASTLTEIRAAFLSTSRLGPGARSPRLSIPK